MELVYYILISTASHLSCRAKNQLSRFSAPRTHAHSGFEAMARFQTNLLQNTLTPFNGLCYTIGQSNPDLQSVAKTILFSNTSCHQDKISNKSLSFVAKHLCRALPV